MSDSEEDRELRKHAVFALSQRPREEAVPELVRIARTHRDPEIRKTAVKLTVETAQAVLRVG